MLAGARNGAASGICVRRLHLRRLRALGVSSRRAVPAEAVLGCDPARSSPGAGASRTPMRRPKKRRSCPLSAAPNRKRRRSPAPRTAVSGHAPSPAARPPPTFFTSRSRARVLFRGMASSAPAVHRMFVALLGLVSLLLLKHRIGFYFDTSTASNNPTIAASGTSRPSFTLPTFWTDRTQGTWPLPPDHYALLTRLGSRPGAITSSTCSSTSVAACSCSCSCRPPVVAGSERGPPGRALHGPRRPALLRPGALNTQPVDTYGALRDPPRPLTWERSLPPPPR